MAETSMIADLEHVVEPAASRAADGEDQDHALARAAQRCRRRCLAVAVVKV